MLSKPSGIPRRSGCYIFRNDRGSIIYVGKARVLAQRLASYFQSGDGLSAKTLRLMAEATTVEWIVTPNELDALILENELIKENQPRYNMRLKDDKSFPYVALDSRTPFTAPYLTRSTHVAGVRYFGPFTDVRAVRATMDELLRAFPLRSCSTHKFNYHARIARPCLLFDIAKCSGPCVGAITAGDYRALELSWARFFEGDVSQLRSHLEESMCEAAARQRYEVAAATRDALAALDRAARTQNVVLDDHSNLDVIAVAGDTGRAALVRFRVRFGRVVGRSVHLIDRSMDESDREVLEGALTVIYQKPDDVPEVVVVGSREEASTLVAQYLRNVRGRAVELVGAPRGARRRVLAVAVADARAVIERDSLRRQSDHNVRAKALVELGEALSLPAPPYRVECFDMSHLQGTNYVGSLVVFEDGLAQKREYRHFTVKETLGNDDVGAMAEVLRRRLAHWDGADSATAFRRADLIIVDGGLPQLHAAQSAARALGLGEVVEFAALAKREELLYRPGSSTPIVLDRGSEALYLVQRLRDEAHRFAVTFHRSKRGKSMVASSLDGVGGLGPVRRERLLAHFGSLGALRGASLDDLEALNWLPNVVAANLYDHLRAPRAARPAKRGATDE